MDKILTIIIPTYNMEKYLRHCLDSLIVSNMDKVEVLVINDGSKDSSSAIAHEYQDKYPQTFRVIDKENGNYGSCINRGLKEATGKYVKVLDADDWFDNESFKHYISDISNIDADLIITDYNFVDDKGNKSKVSYNLPSNKQLPMKQVSSMDDFVKIEMHAVTYRTKNIQSMGYRQTEGISYTDQEWMFWPMTSVRDIFYLHNCLYQYFIGREGQTVTLSQRLKHLDQIIAIQRCSLSLWKEKKDQVGDAGEYIKKRLYRRLSFIYEPDYLLVSNSRKNLIRDFDNYLKKDFPDIYDRSNSILLRMLGFNFPYLRLWRKGDNSLGFRLISLLWRLKGLKHRLF